MEYFKFQFESMPAEKQDLVIAMLSESGFTGFEEDGQMLSAFIPVNDWQENTFKQLIEQYDLKCTRSIIKEENWNAQWEADFDPVMVPHPETGEKWVLIRACFHEPDSAYPLHLEVTPKMSFGTGHHATTFLVVQQMGRMDFTGKKVIDFGAGTGVLAILAEKLGAADILAIDHDTWCMENVAENLAANQCSHIRLLLADSINNADDSVDIILANINLNIIRDNLDGILQRLVPGGKAIFSGLLERDEPVLLAELSSRNARVEGVFHKNGWIMVEALKC